MYLFDLLYEKFVEFFVNFEFRIKFEFVKFEFEKWEFENVFILLNESSFDDYSLFINDCFKLFSCSFSIIKKLLLLLL